MYERGEREPGIETLEAIADFFNVDLDYLIGKSDIPNRMLLGFVPNAGHNIYDNLEDNVVVYHRDGKTSQVKLSREKMDMFAKMIEAIKDNDVDL